MIRSARVLLLLAAFALSASACRYRFAAVGALPGGLTQVRAPVFQNHTAEPGLESLFSGALRQELSRMGVEPEAGAEAELSGEVLGLWGGPTVSTTPTQTPEGVNVPARLASYRLFASVRLRLHKGGQTLAQVDVVGAEDFLPGDDVLGTESNRQAALHRLSLRLMREGLDRLAARPAPTSPSPAPSSAG